MTFGLTNLPFNRPSISSAILLSPIVPCSLLWRRWSSMWGVFEVRGYVYVCICVYVCMYVCMYVYVYIYIYIYDLLSFLLAYWQIEVIELHKPRILNGSGTWWFLLAARTFLTVLKVNPRNSCSGNELTCPIYMKFFI